MASLRTLILNGGGLRGLVATATAVAGGDARQIGVLHVHDGRAKAVEAARRQAEHYGVGRFIEATSPSPPRRVASENTAGQPLMPRATTLLAAVAWAVSLRVEQVIWPAQCADEAERLTQTIELVTLVHHLAMLEHDPVPTIHTPLLEMGDRDLIELGVKLDVPWRLAWTCQLGADVPCLACEACRRRRAAFRTAGITETPERAGQAERPNQNAA